MGSPSVHSVSQLRAGWSQLHLSDSPSCSTCLGHLLGGRQGPRDGMEQGTEDTAALARAEWSLWT